MAQKAITKHAPEWVVSLSAILGYESSDCREKQIYNLIQYYFDFLSIFVRDGWLNVVAIGQCDYTHLTAMAVHWLSCGLARSSVLYVHICRHRSGLQPEWPLTHHVHRTHWLWKSEGGEKALRHSGGHRDAPACGTNPHMDPQWYHGADNTLVLTLNQSKYWTASRTAVQMAHCPSVAPPFWSRQNFLIDELQLDVLNTFIGPRWWILITLMTPWPFLYYPLP